ncbi:MAG: cupin domain-containing protein [Muribaculaceae bacterium]|nr:cupin domain-containing protein [Muribaculaceae bacterium]
MKTDYKFGEVIRFNEAISFSDENVVFSNVFETEYGGVSNVALKAGQKLETHIAPFEVMVTLCVGEIDFTMLDMTHNMKAGEFLLMGANVPHSVVAKQDSIITLVKIKN